LYTPNRDELARQQFVLSLKLLANGRAQQQVRESYRADVLPAIVSSQGAEPTHRREVATPLSQRNEFKLWAVLTHHSQTMMWDAIERTVARVLPEVERRYAALHSSDTRYGSLSLNPKLAVPPPVSSGAKMSMTSRRVCATSVRQRSMPLARVKKMRPGMDVQRPC